MLNWQDAATPPPSDISMSYMRFAANNPAAFFSKTVPQFLGDSDAVSEEDAAHDKKHLNQIRSVLKSFTDRAKAQHGTPAKAEAPAQEAVQPASG